MYQILKKQTLNANTKLMVIEACAPSGFVKISSNQLIF